MMKPLLTLAEQATVRMAKAERKLAKAEAKLLRAEAKWESRKAKVAAARKICEAAAQEAKQLNSHAHTAE
jgi:multidrug resistance efflux pump